MGTRTGRMLVVALAAATALVAAACVPQPTTPGPSADCTNPPALGPGALLMGCALSGLDLAGMDLSGAMLAGADLSNSDLSGANLSDANLEGANLTGADLTGANLTNAILSGAILLGALFLNAILDGALFGFGMVYGPSGLGGTAEPSGGSCVGDYCAGYNSATDNTSAWLCRTTPDGGTAQSGIPIAMSPEQLEEAGGRSVVTDAATDFSGASFVGAETQLFQGLDLREANFEDTTWVDAVFPCNSLDGARFAGASMTRHQFHHVSGRDADFTGLHVFTSWMCETDFTGASFASSTWEGFSGLSCAEFVPDHELDLLPEPLAVFDGADFSGSVMGGVPDPDRGALFALTYDWQGRTRSVSMVGTNLDGTTVTDGLFWRADLAGSTADGATFLGTSRFEDATFPATGWENATFSGVAIFDGATCPDGSTGSPGNPCFTVTP